MRDCFGLTSFQRTRKCEWTKVAGYWGVKIVQEKTLEPRFGYEEAILDHQDKSKRVTGLGNGFPGN